MDSDRTAKLRLGVAGANGHMGRAVIEMAAGLPAVELVAAFGRPGAEGSGRLEHALETCEVIVDFSTPEASTHLATAARAHGGPALVVGTTGLSTEQGAVFAEASRSLAIVKSGNFSLAVNLLAALVEQAARRLPSVQWDIEVLETHHRRKVDAPSGTALMLGEAAARGRNASLADSSVTGRSGATGARPPGAIGFASLRAGGVVGEHSVILASDEEILTLSHSARDRRLFARGALEAALWVRGRPAGLYDMRDVLDLD